MITELCLRHFKCFDELRLSLGKLTLLTGKNSTGKSSVIQSLLFLHQNIVRNAQRESYALNGESVSLGTFGDVLDNQSGRESFEIGTVCNGREESWIFRHEDRASLTVPCEVSFGEHGSQDSIGNENKELCGESVLRQILHVSTERIGPRETYPADTVSESRLGARGEFTPWFLVRNQERQVEQGLCRPGVPPKLLRQAEAWLAYFFPGAALQVERIAKTNLVALRFRTSEMDGFHRPENVGFGLSHMLPVIVGALGIGSRGLLIVENPEAHLHPSAQTEVCMLLANAAASGTQVLVESHSDHIFNGVRRAVKKQCISPDDVRIHYFHPRGEDPRLTALSVAADGALDQWPGGFFDQYEKDLDELTSI